MFILLLFKLLKIYRNSSNEISLIFWVAGIRVGIFCYAHPGDVPRYRDMQG